MFDTLIRLDTLILSNTLGQPMILRQGGLDPACRSKRITLQPTSLPNS